jgi:hypothetical protein
MRTQQTTSPDRPFPPLQWTITLRFRFSMLPSIRTKRSTMQRARERSRSREANGARLVESHLMIDEISSAKHARLCGIHLSCSSQAKRARITSGVWLTNLLSNPASTDFDGEMCRLQAKFVALVEHLHAQHACQNT